MTESNGSMTLPEQKHARYLYRFGRATLRQLADHHGVTLAEIRRIVR